LLCGGLACVVMASVLPLYQTLLRHCSNIGIAVVVYRRKVEAKWHITAACKTSKGLRERIYQDTMNFERGIYLQLPPKAFIGFTRCCVHVASIQFQSKYEHFFI